MSNQESEIFRLSWRSPPFLIYAVLLTALFAFSWPPNIIKVVKYCIYLAMIVVPSQVSVSKEGIRMYYINKVKWEDVESVRYKSIFGLPHFLIKRKSGSRWCLPLYFKGKRTMQSALVEWAPANNPIKRYAQ